MRDFEAVLDFLRKSGDNKVRLMGGEPTLHSQFQKIVNFALADGFSVQIFTNGIFSPDTLSFLDRKKGKIKYSFNLNPPEDYSAPRRRIVLNNLKVLSQHGNCLIGRVIWQKDFNLDYLLDLAEKFSVKVIMLRLANPIISRKNKFVSVKDYLVLAKNIIREIKKVDKNKVRIGFGCGLAMGMFNEKQKRVLKGCGIELKWGCDGNSGRFDIGVDLSVYRCFPLANWDEKKLSDFGSAKEIEDYFENLMLKHQSFQLNKGYIHHGPCFLHLLPNWT